MKKTCIIIAGPTAVGKTALAIEVARHFSTKIISADSRQCYRELNIGVAKPSPGELDAVQHYFINSHNISQDLSAADFESYALRAATEVFLEKDLVVMTGGTGLYIKTFCEGMDEIPPVDKAIRTSLIENYERKGIGYLQEQIKNADPAFYQTGEIQNPQRLLRALEVYLSTGKSITSFRAKQKKQRPFDIIKTGLELPRNILYERINHRVDEMLAAGLVEEVKALYPFKELNALQTVGYRELFEYFDGKTDLQRAIELIKQNTRQYAKRQITWFKKDEEMSWCSPQREKLLDIINDKLGN